MSEPEFLFRVVREEGVPTIYVYADLVFDEAEGVFTGTRDVQRAVDEVSEALYPDESCVIVWDFIGNERMNTSIWALRGGVMRQ